MATLIGKYTYDELKEMNKGGFPLTRYWSLYYYVKYIDVYDTTLSTDIQIAYDSCSRNYIISLNDNKSINTIYTVPQTMCLSEALKSVGFVFQFCTHPNHRMNGVLSQNSCQPEVHIINYENKSKEDALNKREEELALKEDALNKREESQELAIDTLYKSIQKREEELALKEDALNKREEELALKEDALNKREEEELQRICESYN